MLITVKEFQKHLNDMINSIDLPNTNNADKQTMLNDYFVADILVKRGTALRKKSLAAIKTEYALNTLNEINRFEVVDICQPFIVQKKIGNHRNTFDKMKLADALSEKFDTGKLSILREIEKATSPGAAPQSFDVTVSEQGMIDG